MTKYLKNKNSQPILFFSCFKIEDANPASFKTMYFPNSNIILSKKTDRLLSCFFILHFSPAPAFSYTIIFYTMATADLKWAPRNGLPKTSGDTPMSSDDEGPNRDTSDIPTFFTTKHYK
jgi:hypothetical protein